MTPLQRTVILAGACIPLLGVGLFVSFAEAWDGNQVLVVTTLATAGAALFLCSATSRYAAVHLTAGRLRRTLGEGRPGYQDVLSQLPPADGGNDHPVRVLRELSERLAAREAQLQGLVNYITTVMTEIVHHRTAPSLEGLDLPTSVDRLLVFGAYREFLRALVRLRKRATAMTNVLKHLPVAVVVGTRVGTIQSLNAAAERLFGRKSGAASGRPVASLFANAPFGGANPAQLLLVQDGGEAVELLRGGETREVFTTVRGANGQILLVGMRAYFGKKEVFLFRERNPKPSGFLESVQEPESLPAIASYLLHERPPSLN